MENEYEWIRNINDELTAVCQSNKYGVIDTAGRIVIPVEYDHYQYLDRNRIAVKRNDKWGVADNRGKIVIPFEYDELDDLSRGSGAAKLNGKWGFIDRHGKIVVSCEYDEIRNFEKGLAAVKKDDKWGFVNKQGKVIIPFDYCELYEYHNYSVWFFCDRINLCKDGKWGYTDNRGNIRIPFIYDFAHSFIDFGGGYGYARVGFHGKSIVIDTKGKTIFHNKAGYKYPEAIMRLDGQTFFQVSLENPSGKCWGIVDENETIIVPMCYSFEQTDLIIQCCKLIEKSRL